MSRTLQEKSAQCPMPNAPFPIPHRQIVQLLITASREQPAAAKIAIEYLKQGESEENQALIEEIIFYISLNR